MGGEFGTSCNGADEAAWQIVRPVSPHQAEADRLGNAIAELASRIHAATYALLVLIRQFDTCAGWNDGCLSCAHWLNWRTGIDLGAAPGRQEAGVSSRP